MKSLGRLLLLSFLGLLPVGCGQKSANLQKGAVAPDKVLFENGMKYLEKNQYIKARLALQTLVSTYPDSEYTPVAFLSMGDSYYREGGTENLLQAEAQYKDFIIFYPTHEMADDAQMKIAAINVRLMRAPDRDSTYAKKAETELKKLLNDYPDSELAPTARDILTEVQENLARGISGVADFYYHKKSYTAAESRYKEVLEDYGEYSRLDHVLYRLGKTLEKKGQIEEAAVYYSRVVAEYPFSNYSNEARERLVLLERPIPKVDEVAAARNEARIPKGQGFSLLAPVKSVLGIFTGREDPYEVAKRRAEQRRAQRQQSNAKNASSDPHNSPR